VTTDSSTKPYLGQGNITPNPRSEIARRCLWALVQATLFRCSPRGLHGFRIALLRLFGARIPAGGQVRIYPTVRTIYPWKLTCEPRVMIGPDVNIYNLAPVTLGYGAQLSQSVHLCAGTHDYLRWSMPLDARPIHIGANAWLAAEVFVGPGVTIGELAVIGARSVVIKDQPARMVCAGHPCRPLKPRPDPQ
jgi:putative colanic acid biosynthesis acetyltransferase WcaF